MRVRLAISLIVVLAIIAEAIFTQRHAPTTQQKLPDLGRGQITAFWLKPDAEESFKNLGKNDSNYLHSWPILKQIDLSAQQAVQLRAIIENSESYGQSAKKCFEPELAFRSETEDHHAVEILISLNCDQVRAIADHTAEYRALSSKGSSELKQLFDQLFTSGH